MVLIETSGSSQSHKDPLADTGRTVKTGNLLTSQKRIAVEGKFKFGLHDDTVYGLRITVLIWRNPSGLRQILL